MNAVRLTDQREPIYWVKVEAKVSFADGLGNGAYKFSNTELTPERRGCVSPSRCGNFRLESRMRENRPYGSEGGEDKTFPTPIDRPKRNYTNRTIVMSDLIRHPEIEAYLPFRVLNHINQTNHSSNVLCTQNAKYTFDFLDTGFRGYDDRPKRNYTNREIVMPDFDPASRNRSVFTVSCT